MTETDTRWLDLGEFIREQRRIGHLSLRKLSEMAGISNPYLSQIERGLRKPSAEILQQIARALEISSETLYVRAGILDDERPHDLISEIRRDLWLTEDQKKALISIYDSFRAESARRDDAPPPDDRPQEATGAEAQIAAGTEVEGADPERPDDDDVADGEVVSEVRPPVPAESLVER